MAGTPGNIRFRLINRSNAAIKSLQISLTSRDKWEENILTALIPPGDFATIRVTGSMNCLYDMRVTTVNGGEMVEYNVDLCQLETFTVH